MLDGDTNIVALKGVFAEFEAFPDSTVFREIIL